MNRTMLLAAASLALFAVPAVAADLYIDQPDELPIIDEGPVYDWTGAYVGVHGGVAQGLFKHPFGIGYDCYDYNKGLCNGQDGGAIDLLDGSGDVTAGGFLYGVQAGFNYRLDPNNMVVVGLEADISGSTLDGRVSIDAATGPDLPPLDFHIDAGTSLDWLATIRGRVGALVTEDTLVYLTGGAAYGQTTSSLNADFNGTSVLELSETNDRMGYVVGAGLEHMITENISFKTEYLYTDLGTENLFDGTVFDPITATVDSTVAFHTVRAGLNFSF
jgi:outer membrane immunogenic protein